MFRITPAIVINLPAKNLLDVEIKGKKENNLRRSVILLHVRARPTQRQLNPYQQNLRWQ